MKDILKVAGTYFALGFGTIAGIGAGMKVCEKLSGNKSKEHHEEKGKVIKFVKESE